jgi:hypothetical protein
VFSEEEEVGDHGEGESVDHVGVLAAPQLFGRVVGFGSAVELRFDGERQGERGAEAEVRDADVSFSDGLSRTERSPDQDVRCGDRRLPSLMSRWITLLFWCR